MRFVSFKKCSQRPPETPKLSKERKKAAEVLRVSNPNYKRRKEERKDEKAISSLFIIKTDAS